MSKVLERRGECKVCGGCCHLPISQPRAWAQLARTADPSMRMVVREDRTHLFLDTCPELQPDGRCGIHDTLPDMCRRFPTGPGEIERIPGCTYWFVLLVDGEERKVYRAPEVPA